MPTSVSSCRSLPDAADFCPGCGRVSCRCSPEPEYGPEYGRSYRTGHSACAHDGYDERPMTEWVYRSGSRTVLDPATGPDGRRRLVHVMTLYRFAGLTWRRTFATEADYRLWFERTYGLDLAAYLAGYDDAGCGLPSAVDDPEAYAAAAPALDRYEPLDGAGLADERSSRRAA